MSIIADLNWRYASKRFNGKQIDGDKLQVIQNATNLAATSYGLQPFTIIAVENEEIKLALQKAAYGQPQLSESAVVFVFCVPEVISTEMIEVFIKRVSETRNIPLIALKEYEGMIKGTVGNLDAAGQQQWAAKQAYIALGTAMAAAAEQKVDTCPMEGFDHVQFDEILHLKSKGLLSTVLLALGYRGEEDATATMAKVRKPLTELFETIA